jgi:AcrR family transcriptional regulator
MVYHQSVGREGAVVNTLNEQERSTKSRNYLKVKRADHEARTRARIVDAAEELHGTVGPARATISAIAERAGVTRATVYRHFPDDETLFVACSSQWLSRHSLPDHELWATYDDPWARLRAGLLDVYRYFREGEQMLTLVLRDADVVPASVRAARVERQELWVRLLLTGLPGRRRATVRGAVAHATEFDTWRSLCVGQGLSDGAAADLMVGMTKSAAGS